MPTVNELEPRPSELKELFQLHMGAGAERLCASCYHHCILVWFTAKNVTILQMAMDDSKGSDFLVANAGCKSHVH